MRISLRPILLCTRLVRWNRMRDPSHLSGKSGYAYDLSTRTELGLLTRRNKHTEAKAYDVC